jgi:hypothetical protein
LREETRSAQLKRKIEPGPDLMRRETENEASGDAETWRGAARLREKAGELQNLAPLKTEPAKRKTGPGGALREIHRKGNPDSSGAKT